MEDLVPFTEVLWGNHDFYLGLFFWWTSSSPVDTAQGTFVGSRT